MSDEISLSQALSSLNDADFGKIRTVVSPPGKARGIWIAAYDFLLHVAKKKNPRDALAEIRRQHPEVVAFSDNLYKFPGQGQKDTPIILVRDAVKLLQVTPGDAGNEARARSSSLMRRYYGGDMSQSSRNARGSSAQGSESSSTSASRLAKFAPRSKERNPKR